ncbi:hypothetical protein PFICI_14666 [Pestalotiopsis fici W106-1]|uniref:FAD-binding domain-containing protein n=1 Tax=Pestalotiopsis fici (strain W106-1 / CGMCC3.15140) TaxID=1229662 RepID=W3WII7_PESFW|nr:uncharacterized protein PFICI_14666 [Pestalotiopsis fici W106-1]ETS73720.1 hypothetical protein PFICI_14666 [Pestalotiopsis fici W106-1]
MTQHMFNSIATSDSPILIVGGGLGGLALAQALRKRQIPYRIFDRDSAPDSRRQGWNIALHWIIADFERHFPNDLVPVESVSHMYEHGYLSEGAIFDGLHGNEVQRFGAKTGKDFIRAERPKLRAWLATNIDVEWDKMFSRFEEVDKTVKVYFTDGTMAEGCMLIGADGANSPVRSQLLGPEKSKLEVLPMDVYTGELTLTKEEYQGQWARFARSLYIVQSPEAYLFVGLRNISSDGNFAQYYWMVFRHHTEAEIKCGHSTKDWSKDKLLQAARDTVEKLNPQFRELIHKTNPEGMVQPPLYMEKFLPSPEGFGGKRVTLLGDAAHKMPPFKGEGGNHAMKDGMQLVDLLDEGCPDIYGLIQQYELTIIGRGRDAVESTSFAAMNWVQGTAHSAWQDKLGR